MAVSESVLNAVNLFSSTSVFNANKGSVGATDLNFIKQTTAELATEGGGIIAQSLGTNGYVKFANGLILQWGYKNQNNNYMVRTLPISCNEILVGVATPFGSYEHGCGTFDYTQTTISIRMGSGVYGRYIAICKQQWGFLTSVNKDKTTVFDMPLSVTVVYHFNMQANVQRASNSYLNGHAFVGHNGNASITIGDSDHGSAKWWFAICKAQQWGYADDLTKEATIYFPIAFTSPPFTLVGVEFYIANSGRNYCTKITATYFSTHSELRTSGTDSYLAIGVQQWGEFLTTSSQFATYPLTISMSNNLYHIFGNHIGITQSTYAVIFGKKTLNDFQCKSGVSSQIVNWIILGYQQWGRSYTAATVSFPISFTSTPSIYFATVFNQNTLSSPPGPDIYIPQNLTNSQFRVGTISHIWQNCDLSYLFVGY